MKKNIQTKFIITTILLNLVCGDFCWGTEQHPNNIPSNLSPRIQSTELTLNKAFSAISDILNSFKAKPPSESSLIKNRMFESSKINKKYFGEYINKSVLFLKAAKELYVSNKALDKEFTKKRAAAKLEKRNRPLLKKISLILKRPFTANSKLDMEDPVKILTVQKKAAHQNTHEKIMNTYGLNMERFDVLDLLQKKYFSAPNKIKISGMWYLFSEIIKLYPEYAHINTESYMLYEVALRAKINFTEKEKIQKKIEDNLIAILYPQNYLKVTNTYSDILSQINIMDKHSIEGGITLIKLLANITELEDYPFEQLQARNFLKFFVANILAENNDILLDFEDMVITKIQAAQKQYGKDAVKTVTMLTGAEPLGQMIRQTMKRSGIDVNMADLLLTTKMCEELGDIDDIKDVPNIRSGLEKYLIENDIIDKKTKHIIFIDTGFMGTINEYLSKALTMKGISKDYLTIASGSNIFNSNHIPTGLNSYNFIKGGPSLERLIRFAFIIDDGFEHALFSPVGFTGQTEVEQYSTHRKWFYNLIVESIKNIPTYSVYVQEKSPIDPLHHFIKEGLEPRKEMDTVNRNNKLIITSI